MPVRLFNSKLRWSFLAMIGCLLSGSLWAGPFSHFRHHHGSCDQDSGQGATCFSETYKAPPSALKAMDYLVILQTSDSINNEMPLIRAGLEGLIDSLPADADSNVAVMLSHGSTSSRSGRLHRAGNEPVVLRSRFLTKSQMKALLNQKLANLPQDPDSGGGEEGMFSLFNGISSPALLAENQAADFFRSEAGLMTIFVADRRDICAVIPAGVPPETDPAKVNARIRDCEGLTAQGLISRLQQLKGNQALRVTGVFYAKPPVPAGHEISYGITDLIKLNSSVAADVAQDNISQVLTGAIPGGIGSSMPEFTLSRSGVESASVQVTVNGKAATFQVNGNKVRLTQAVPAGSTVVISYCLAGINYGSKAEKLAAIMAMSCPIPNKSYPKNYKSPTPDQIKARLKACTPEVYPETPTTKKQQATLNRLLDPNNDSLRWKMFHKLWYTPEFSDHFEYYFGLEIKEAVQIFCLENPYLSDTLITSEYTQHWYDRYDYWASNPDMQKRWRFAQMLRKQIKSCLNQ